MKENGKLELIAESLFETDKILKNNNQKEWNSLLQDEKKYYYSLTENVLSKLGIYDAKNDEFNIMLATDSYKHTHHKFYMPNTCKVYSYLESRTGARFNKTVFYGLQYILKKYLSGVVVTEQKIIEAKQYIDEHIGPNIFNEKGWRYILENYGGKLPLEIKAVEEGTPVDVNNVLMVVYNTDDNVPWLTNFVESILMHSSYPSTVASLSRECKILINDYLSLTSNNNSGLVFMLHDFGYRGGYMHEGTCIAGSAHLISFKGTDTTHTLKFIKDWYNTKNMPGYSVQATEHSIMTSRGEEKEIDVIKNILKSAEDGILSLVIDSFNYARFITYLGRNEYLRQDVNTFLNRKQGNKIVFRPDSGSPTSVTLECLELLERYFGSTLNTKGFKILPNNIGILWGDGIDYLGVRDILFAMRNNNWAASNIVFGMGGGLHASVNRDTQRNAFKCSSQYYDGGWHDVYKKPLDATKVSKKGRLALIKDTKGFKTIPLDELENRENYLKTVFLNGEIVKEYTFEEIVEKAKI